MEVKDHLPFTVVFLEHIWTCSSSTTAGLVRWAPFQSLSVRSLYDILRTPYSFSHYQCIGKLYRYLVSNIMKSPQQLFNAL